MQMQLLKRSMSVLFSIVCLSSYADNSQYLTIKQNDTADTETSFSMDKFCKITFDSNNMIVMTTDGENQFPLSELDKMFFSETQTGIETTENIPVSQDAKIYTLSGVQVPSCACQRGIYIIKKNGTTTKVVKK